MPEEIFIIIIVGIAAGTLSGITAQLFNYLKSRDPEPSTSDASMTTSELEDMIQKWIKEATRPLANRLEKIEEKLDMDLLDAPGHKSILEDMDGYEEVQEKELSPRRRAKS